MKTENRGILLIAGIVFLVIVTFLGSYIFSRWIHQPLPLEDEKRVRIRPGMTGRAIGRLLKEEGVIESVEAFRWAIWLHGVERDLRLGTVLLEPPLTRYQLVEKLRQKNPELVRVRLKEGWPSWRIFEELARKLEIEKNEFEEVFADPEFLSSRGIEAETAEGYLYPETYYFSLDASAEEILAQMIDKFKSVIRQLDFEKKAEDLGYEPHEMVTLASIIEREARVVHEYPLVSAVYHNRLQRGMKLQADPTVLYALGDFEAPITRSALNRYSEFNTYEKRGLPPRPICSPGFNSLEAAVNPAETEDLFFVSRGDGTHVFSRTYREHQQAVNKYQR